MAFALERAAAFSFLLLVAALPWSIAPMSIAVVLCGVLTVALWWRPGGPRWVRTPIDGPALGWMAALAIAAAAGLDPSGSAGRISKGLLVAIIPVAVYHGRDPKLVRRAVAILLISAGVATLYALIKFAAQGGVFPVRVRGAVGHPLTYGGQAMLLATMAGAFLVRSRDRRWRVGAAALLILLAPALLGSYTRSAWIGTLVAFGTILAFTRARWLAGLAPVVLALFVLLPHGYKERASSAFDPRNKWNVERVHLWTAGWRMFRERPVTGVGLQDLHPLMERYRSPDAHETHGHLHSIYVQIGATMGVVGLLAFAWLAVGLYRTAGRRLRAALRRGADGTDSRIGADGIGVGLRVAAVAALTGFFVAGLFEWNFGDEELLDFLYTLVGLAFAASGWERDWDGKRPSS